MKKANADAANAREESRKTEAKRLAELDKERGKEAHDALAAEMGFAQDYTDFKIAERRGRTRRGRKPTRRRRNS